MKYLICVYESLGESIEFDIIDTLIEPGTEEWDTLIEGYDGNWSSIIAVELTEKNIKSIRNGKMKDLMNDSEWFNNIPKTKPEEE